jgi:glycosyltransferase involved in cell wall biosynthesis
LNDRKHQGYGSPSDPKYDAEGPGAHQGAQTGTYGGVRRLDERAVGDLVYRRADVVAMVSISQGFPYALIESMLSGAAIAATDVGGVREALLVLPCDPPSMAKAIIALLSSAAERRRLGEMARAGAAVLLGRQVRAPAS